MKQSNHPNTNAAGKAGSYSDQRALAVQMLTAGKLPVRILRRLRFWIESCLTAHNNRVSALGVYRQRRVDGAGFGDREESAPASK
jgi:hypothetical protein